MKRHTGSIPIAAMIVSTLFVSFASLTEKRAMACDCLWPGSPREELQRKDAVFSGEIISRDFKSAKVEFKVEKFWKGPRAKKISLKYIGSDCTYLFVVGKKYLVYTSGKEILETDICTRTKELNKVSDDLKELGGDEEP